jgi:hypothetical protein
MQYMLFVMDGDSNSLQALNLVRKKIDEVHTISLANKPTWLKGVPTIVDVQNTNVYEGSQCLLFMQKRNASESKNKTDDVDAVHFVDMVD